MAKSKQGSVSKVKLAKAGEELEVAGAVTAYEGAAEVGEGDAKGLQVAKAAARVGVTEVAAGASDLTSAADAASDAAHIQALSEIVGAAGVVDVAEGVDMLIKGGNVRAMGAIVGLMSKEELERGLELARLAGELWTISDVVSAALDMPVLADYLEERHAPAANRLRSAAALHRYTCPGGSDQAGRCRHRRPWASKKSPRVWCVWQCPRQRPSAAPTCTWRVTCWRHGVWTRWRLRRRRARWRVRPEEPASLTSPRAPTTSVRAKPPPPAVQPWQAPASRRRSVDRGAGR